jgi:hypothetical protein
VLFLLTSAENGHRNRAGIDHALTPIPRRASLAWLQRCSRGNGGRLLGDNVKRLLTGLGLVALTASIACSNSATGPSQVSSKTSAGSTFNVLVRPSPITATHCNQQCAGDSSGSFAFSADMTIEVQNSSGVGGTVSSITLTGSADGTTFPPLTFSSDEIKGEAGTIHVDAHSTLSMPVTIVYNTPSGKANLSISISLQITDDGNNPVTASGQVNVV